MVAQVLSTETASQFDSSQSIFDWNAAYLQAHTASGPHMQQGLRVRAMIDGTSRKRNEEDLTAALSSDSTTMVDALNGLQLLEEWGSSGTAFVTYKEEASKRWKEASAFQMG